MHSTTISAIRNSSPAVIRWSTASVPAYSVMTGAPAPSHSPSSAAASAITPPAARYTAALRTRRSRKNGMTAAAATGHRIRHGTIQKGMFAIPTGSFLPAQNGGRKISSIYYSPVFCERQGQYPGVFTKNARAKFALFAKKRPV